MIKTGLNRPTFHQFACPTPQHNHSQRKQHNHYRRNRQQSFLPTKPLQKAHGIIGGRVCWDTASWWVTASGTAGGGLRLIGVMVKEHFGSIALPPLATAIILGELTNDLQQDLANLIK